MKRAAVESSAIKSVGHDPETNKLHVEFHGRKKRAGAVAEYDDVDAAKHAALLGAESVGKFFHAQIRNNKAHAWRYVA